MDSGTDHTESISRLLNHLRGDQHLHRRTLGVILGLTHIAKKGGERREILKEMVDCLSLELGFENCSILEYDHERQGLVLIAAKGILDLLDESGAEKFNKELCIREGDCIAWKVFSSKEPIFIEDTSIENIPRVSKGNVKIRSMACLPLGELGVINLSTSCPRSFSITQRRDLIIIAELISNLMETLDLKGKGEVSSTYVHRIIEAKTRELAQSKQELKEALELFDSMIHGVPQGLALIDLGGRIYSINDALCNMAKATPKELLQLPFDVLFQRHSDIEKISSAIKAGKMVQINSGILRAVNGELVPVDIFYHPFSLKGHGIGGMLIFHDLRGQRKRLEEMVQIEKMKALGLMAKGVAHDFNNILSMILGNIEILDRELENESHKERLNRIHNAVVEGAKIVERLNAYVGGGEEGGRLNTRSLPTVVDQAIDFLTPRIKELRDKEGVVVDFNVDVEEVGEVLIDPEDLKEVLVNMLLNSLEAMPDGGTVTVCARREDEEVKIDIIDSGTGIPKSERSKIFDPFYTTKGVKASGLGLCVSKGIVQNCGGAIALESEEGKGTKFTIRLPLRTSPEAVKPDEGDKHITEPIAIPQALKVLIVDDEFIIVELLTTLLKGLGHNVTGIADPLKARSILKEEVFDLVITDLGMPGVSGFELAKSVKERNPNTKVVLITGWGADYEKKDLRDRGVDGVLGKPFKLAELKRLIRDLFK